MRPPSKRLAIIGGGMGGVATAWFCDFDWSISLFETKEKLGGNCDSETIHSHKREFVVDLGAQFFHPETHPTYISVLELLELLDPRGIGQKERRFEIPAGLCVSPLDGSRPYFSSTHVARTPLHAVDFAVFGSAARKMALGGSYDVTIESWVDGLRVSKSFKSQIVLPWLTASEGHPLHDTKRSSARAILQLFAPSHPRSLLHKATTWRSGGGFQGTIMALAKQCQHTSVHTRSRVQRVEKAVDGWFVYTPDTRSGPFDAVVINAPPWESKKMLMRLPWAEHLTALLDRYEHLSHRLTIHADPTYVHRDRRNWTLANVGVGGRRHDERSELSIWLGAVLEKVDDAPIDVFKSWTSYRETEPKQVMFERTFQHSIKTPSMMDASRRLRSWQGKEGLWFAGHFTSGIDLQESALCSAMDVGRALCPSSPNLAALESRMKPARG